MNINMLGNTIVCTDSMNDKLTIEVYTKHLQFIMERDGDKYVWVDVPDNLLEAIDKMLDLDYLSHYTASPELVYIQPPERLQAPLSLAMFPSKSELKSIKNYLVARLNTHDEMLKATFYNVQSTVKAYPNYDARELEPQSVINEISRRVSEQVHNKAKF